MAADIISAVAWPAVIALIVLLFGKDIVRGVSGLASRAEGVKVGVAGVSVELNLARRLDDQAARSVQSDLMLGAGGPVVGSGAPDLYKYFNAESGGGDYVVVDLGEGRGWLSSRLYLLAVLAARQRGVTQMVFLCERDYPGAYFGTAPVDAVVRALTRSEPDLEAAMSWSLYRVHRIGGGPTFKEEGMLDSSSEHPVTPQGARVRNFPMDENAKFMDDAPLNNLVRNYLQVLQAGPSGPLPPQPPPGQPPPAPAPPPAQPPLGLSAPPPPPSGWTPIPSGLERASWMEPAHLARLLGDRLSTERILWSQRENAAAAEGQEAPWIALVDEVGRFKALARRRMVPASAPRPPGPRGDSPA